MEMTRRFDDQTYLQALFEWTWLDPLATLTPRLTNAFGDAFLEAPDGSFWFLDTIDGTLQKFWASGSELEASLNTRESQNRFLLVGLVEAAHAAGLVPGPTGVLSFVVPPVLGGAFEVANLEVADYVVSVDVLGQIHRQVKDLPPGAPISGFKIT